MSVDMTQTQKKLWILSDLYYHEAGLRANASGEFAEFLQARMDGFAEEYNDLAGINQEDRRHPPPPNGGPPPQW